MENRYLFKARSIGNRKWVYGSLVQFANESYIVTISEDVHTVVFTKVDSSTICQCMEFKDEDDNLVWANDIVSTISSDPTGELICKDNIIVNPKDHKLMFSLEFSNELRVVGNIFDDTKFCNKSPK